MLRAVALLALTAQFLPVRAQQKDLAASEILKHGLHFADLYNWSVAAPEFSKAEKLFLAAGDQRNALYARLGKIRANLERGNLAETSFQLATELDMNPQLQSDKELRMFCLTLKGDIDGEIDSGAMRRDWEEVQSLARELGSIKWQYRALAQLGLAAFYEGDIETARKNVGAALLAARTAGDAGAQIRYLTALGVGLLKSKMYDRALPYFDSALKVASATPDAPYPFLAHESKVQALIGLNQFDTAEHLNADFLTPSSSIGLGIWETD